MNNECEQYLQAIREMANTYAEAKSSRVHLEHGRHLLLARLMSDAEVEGHKSVAAQDREARNKPEYARHLEGLAAAVAAETQAEWELKVLEWRIEIWRTEQANQRAERARYAA